MKRLCKLALILCMVCAMLLFSGCDMEDLEELLSNFGSSQTGGATPGTPQDLSPVIGENGNWWIGDIDLGVPAETDEEDGETLTPYRGENGNWWIGEVDTHVPYATTTTTTGGVEDVYLNEDGDLIVKRDGVEKNLGRLSGDSAVSIRTVRVTETGAFCVTLSNGIVLQTMPLDIGFEGYINGMLIDEKGELTIYTSIGQDVCYGKISAITLSEEGELIVSFESGDDLSFGTVTGVGDVCTHTFGDYVTGIDPTCTSIGYRWRVCTLCNEKEIDVLPALDHTYGNGHMFATSDAGAPVIALYACTVCGSVKMEEVKYSVGLTYELIDTKEEYRVKDAGTCTDTEIRIPDAYQGLPVTEIGEKAFYGQEGLTSIIMPDSIKKIGDKAFSNCESLEQVTMPDTAEIGKDVFRGSIKVDIVISHKIVHVEAKEATCTEAGHRAHYYCEVCDLCYEDAAATIRIYDVTIPAAHDFKDGVCQKCGQIQNEVLIVSVDSIPSLGKFPLGTLENAIGLPAKVNVHTADGKTHAMPVSWELSTYDKSKTGSYTINGHIIAPEFHYATGVSSLVEAKVEITETMQGTADIVFVLDISGSMDDEIANVKDNLVRFAQEIEDRGVSARFSAITYSDYAYYGSKEDSVILMNGASDWFITAESCKAAIEGIDLLNGGDAPEVAIDGLMLAHTLTTRSDARVFYILLTDATYKTANKHGVKDMDEAVDILARDDINVSVITSNSCRSDYSALTNETGGIMSRITGNFCQDLIDSLVPIIYGEVMD